MRWMGVVALLLAPWAMKAQAVRKLPIDTKASVLLWTGHAEVGPYAPSGKLSVRAGEVVLRQGRFQQADLVVDMHSMTQSNAELLHHLQSADFFDVEHYPEARIHIDRLSGGKVYGTLTIRDKTGPLEAPVQVQTTPDRFRIAGKVTLDRTAYGIVYNSSSLFSGLGDKAIRNTFEVEFALEGTGALPDPEKL